MQKLYNIILVIFQIILERIHATLKMPLLKKLALILRSQTIPLIFFFLLMLCTLTTNLSSGEIAQPFQLEILMGSVLKLSPNKPILPRNAKLRNPSAKDLRRIYHKLLQVRMDLDYLTMNIGFKKKQASCNIIITRA